MWGVWTLRGPGSKWAQHSSGEQFPAKDYPRKRKAVQNGFRNVVWFLRRFRRRWDDHSKMSCWSPRATGSCRGGTKNLPGASRFYFSEENWEENSHKKLKKPRKESAIAWCSIITPEICPFKAVIATIFPSMFTSPLKGILAVGINLDSLRLPGSDGKTWPWLLE